MCIAGNQHVPRHVSGALLSLPGGNGPLCRAPVSMASLQVIHIPCRLKLLSAAQIMNESGLVRQVLIAHALICVVPIRSPTAYRYD